jgi:hypothetical protein
MDFRIFSVPYSWFIKEMAEKCERFVKFLVLRNNLSEDLVSGNKRKGFFFNIVIFL